MASKGQQDAPALGDAIELQSNGTVLLRWDTYTVTLRRPKAREWGAYIEAMEQADEWLKVDGGRRKNADFISGDNPYLAIYVKILAELGDEKVEWEDLPVWMLNGTTLSRLNVHWLTVPLPPSEPATAKETR